MNAQQLDQLASEAMARITSHINRSAGQHSRAVEAALANRLNALLGHHSPFAMRTPEGGTVYVTSRSARAQWQALNTTRKDAAA